MLYPSPTLYPAATIYPGMTIEAPAGGWVWTPPVRPRRRAHRITLEAAVEVDDAIELVVTPHAPIVRAKVLGALWAAGELDDAEFVALMGVAGPTLASNRPGA